VINLGHTVIEGKCWVFGDDIDTDVIIPARYVRLRDITEIARHAMEPVDENFGRLCGPGDIVVGGKMFGTGSSREVAVLVFKVLGVGAIVAESFGRIFFRNCINNGIYAIEAPGVRSIASSGERLRIELESGRIVNLSKGLEVRAVAIPPMMRAVVEAGGLVAFLKRKYFGR